MSTHRVLIPLTDSTISQQIVPVIQHLFDAENTSLVLLSVVQPMVPANSPLFSTTGYSSYVETLDHPQILDYEDWLHQWERHQQELKTSLSAVQRRLQAAGFQVTLILRTGDPVQEIVTHAEAGDYDLLAMATHGRTGLSRYMLGSVAEKVLRNVSIPLLLMRPVGKEEGQQSPADKLASTIHTQLPLSIAVATDGSSHGQQALAFGSYLCEVMNVEMKLLVTVDERADAAQAQKVMQATLAELEPLHVKAQAIPLVGYTDDNVIKYMSENPADLLITGAFKDKVAGNKTAIGQTAREIVRHTPASVLLVKGRAKEIRNMLVCVAHDDLAVVDVAANLAQALDAKLKVLHVLPAASEQKPHPVDTSELPLDEILARGLFHREADAAKIVPVAVDDLVGEGAPVSQFLKSAAKKVETAGQERSDLLVLRGPVVESILQVAQEEKPDLIVVGSQSGPGYFMGSTASAVLELSPISVLVVRTKPH